MNCAGPILRRRLLRPLTLTTRQQPMAAPFGTTPIPQGMPPGTPIPGLENIYPKAKDPSQSNVPTSKPREEYPAWVTELTTPLPSLAKLRSMNIEDATDKDMKRYLKLVRKAKIKANNEERRKK
ncbi:hypothetical protein ACHAXT_010926 [Thalassiosira profunda]